MKSRASNAVNGENTPANAKNAAAVSKPIIGGGQCPVDPPDSGPCGIPQTGCLVRGKVLSRARREVKNKLGETRFMITLSLAGSTGAYVIQRWSDDALPQDVPVVGQDVEIPVALTAYLQAGVPKVRMSWLSEEMGEPF